MSTDFYKTFSVCRFVHLRLVDFLQIEASRQQIAIDLFLFGVDYMDVATLSHASKYSGGTTYYFADYSSLTSQGDSLL